MISTSEHGNAADDLMHARVIDSDGTPASVVSLQGGAENTLVWIRAGDGPQVLIPVDLLTREPDGAYRLPFSFAATPAANGNSQITFPVHQETLHIEKRIADTGRGVRVHKTVTEHEHIVDEPLLHDELEVEHIVIGALVAETNPPRMRYEGDTLVVPVLEEVLVVQKQLRLKEEVRITRHRRETHAPQTIVLRSEEVEVERFDDSVKGGKSWHS
jgi:uncharacterized protein (TIGR02271 family)